MAVHKPAQPSTPSSKQETGLGCLTRLSWMLVGNAGIIVSAIAIGKHNGSFLSYADLTFWLAVLFTLAMRYIDITRMQGLTATGEPATLSHWRRHILFLAIGAGVLWAIVHALA